MSFYKLGLIREDLGTLWTPELEAFAISIDEADDLAPDNCDKLEDLVDDVCQPLPHIVNANLPNVVEPYGFERVQMLGDSFVKTWKAVEKPPTQSPCRVGCEHCHDLHPSVTYR